MISHHFLDEPQLSRLPTARLSELMALYRAQGWWDDTAENAGFLRKLILGSHLFLTTEKNGHFVGMGRVISDGVSDAYIQDVAVAEAFRGQGIGTAIVQQLVARLKTQKIQWIGLIAENQSAAFYKPLGFSPMKNAAPMLLKKTTCN